MGSVREKLSLRSLKDSSRNWLIRHSGPDKLGWSDSFVGFLPIRILQFPSNIVSCHGNAFAEQSRCFCVVGMKGADCN